MGYARAAAALGVGVACGEIAPAKLTDDVIYHDFSIFSEIASTSSGVELMNCEIIVLGNSARSTSDLVLAHAVMKDAIDAGAVREALRRAGLSVECELAEGDRDRLINVFAKCEPDRSGATRGRSFPVSGRAAATLARSGRPGRSSSNGIRLRWAGDGGVRSSPSGVASNSDGLGNGSLASSPE